MISVYLLLDCFVGWGARWGSPALVIGVGLMGLIGLMGTSLKLSACDKNNGFCLVRAR